MTNTSPGTTRTSTAFHPRAVALPTRGVALSVPSMRTRSSVEAPRQIPSNPIALNKTVHSNPVKPWRLNELSARSTATTRTAVKMSDWTSRRFFVRRWAIDSSSPERGRKSQVVTYARSPMPRTMASSEKTMRTRRSLTPRRMAIPAHTPPRM